MAVKADLHELAQQIAREVGQPTQSKEVQDCHYTSVDYGLGSRSCEVAYHSFYESTPESAKLISSLTFGIVSRARQLSKNVNPPSNPNNLVTYNFYDKGKSCLIDGWVIEMGNAPYGNIPLNFDGKQGLFTTIVCSSNALEEYFPVIDGSDYLP